MNKEELWERAYSDRVYPNKEIEGNRVLLSYENSEIFAEQTISCISGQSKSRKTFLMSLLIEQLFNPTSGFESDFCDEILYIDTEQSQRRIESITHRFSRPELITFVSIREYGIAERYYIIEKGIEKLRPSIVVIDGVADLCADVNDQAYSTKLLNKLLEWTGKYKCHITTVLHNNPMGEKMRGALGTQMQHKASCVMASETKGPITRITSTFNRDKDFNPFKFTINESGIPVMK